MTQERADRVGDLMKEEIASRIYKYLDEDPSTLVTITRVAVTPNLMGAKVFVSVWPNGKGEKIVTSLRKEAGRLQQELNKLLRMRPVPKIAFVHDSMTYKVAHVEKLLDEIKEE